MNSLAIIVARGNSKRIPKKNLKKIGGHPLIYWTSKAVLKSKFDNIVISTENKEIAAAGELAGIKRFFWRPKSLTRDFTDDLKIILHALKKSEKKFQKKFQIIGLIQPTTPFLRTKHINECLDKMIKKKLSCVFTARTIKEHPRLMWKYSKKN